MRLSHEGRSSHSIDKAPKKKKKGQETVVSMVQLRRIWLPDSRARDTREKTVCRRSSAAPLPESHQQSLFPPAAVAGGGASSAPAQSSSAEEGPIPPEETGGSVSATRSPPDAVLITACMPLHL